MKKQITLLGICFMLTTAIVFSAFTQKEKNKQDQKEQKQNGKNKEDKQGNNRGNGEYKNEKGGHDGNMEKEKGNKDKNDDKVRNDDREDDGKKNDKDYSKNGKDKSDDYRWDRENFKNRSKVRSGEKVAICHKFDRDDEPAVTIRVSSNAAKAHLRHGDVMGDCPAVANSRYSDKYIRNRNDYYNNLQDGQEQVLYSRSILDYAVQRLTNSRSQLATMRTNNTPVADIERKQATVLELEQNVSLLETLIGATANLLANKFR